MLEIKDITASIKASKKVVLNHFSLTIKPGEIHAIMGPNGVGKSTLSKVLLHHKDYEVLSGSMTYQGTDLEKLSTDEIARLGIFLLMQDPVVIDGVRNSECIKMALNARKEEPVNLYQFIQEMKQEMTNLKMPADMMHRFVNQGFSGGEKKKNEMLQLKMLKPSFILLDELDSGLDVDSLKVVCQNLNDYLQTYPDTSVLIITHYSRILDLIHPDYVHQMMNGTIVKTGDMTLAKEIEKEGYHGVNEVSEKGQA